MLDERDAGRLRDERHCARCARVCLEHVEVVAYERELQVEQAPRAEPARDRSSRQSRIASARRRTLGAGTTTAESPEWLPVRSTCSRIAATHASLAVAEDVDVELDRVLEEAVDEARAVHVELAGTACDVDAAAADDVVRPDKHGIAQFLC